MAHDGIEALQSGPSLLPHLVADLLQVRAKLTLEPSQFWAVLDILPVAVLISTDPACTEIVGNAASRMLLRAPTGQNLSRTAPHEESPPFEVYVNGELVPPSALPMQRAASTGKPVPRSECEVRWADGTSVFLAGHSEPLFDQYGEVCGSIGAFVDITHIKRLEQKNALLMGELSHRVKNTVAVIQGIASQTIKPLLPDDKFAIFEARLQAFSHAHELLFASPSSEASLSDIIRAALDHVLGADCPNVRSRGPAIWISQQNALALVMILHELATNALKHGALSRPGGSLEIMWRAEVGEPATLAALEWKELGGPAVKRTPARGFGTKMIAAAAQSFKGGGIKIEHAASGIECTIRMPIQRSIGGSRF